MIGRALRYKRKEGGFTLKELGEKTDLSHAAISRYERGERTPSTEILQRLVDALDTTVDDLEQLAVELAPPAEDAEEKRPAGYAETDDQADTWMRLVSKSPDIADDYARFVLMTLPMFLEGGVVPVTVEDVLEKTHLQNEQAVRSAWSEVVSSAFVERIGSSAAEDRGVWVLKLRFPEDET